MTGKLASALSQAQSKFKPIVKDRIVKGSFSYRYADLAAVIAATAPALAEHKLAVIQTPKLRDDGSQVLVTTLLHESGETMTAEWPLPKAAKSQEMGSALTYARRYCLSAILGVAAEDDDDAHIADNTGKETAPKNGNGNGHKPDTPPAPPADATTKLRQNAAAKAGGKMLDLVIDGGEVRQFATAGEWLKGFRDAIKAVERDKESVGQLWDANFELMSKIQVEALAKKNTAALGECKSLADWAHQILWKQKEGLVA